MIKRVDHDSSLAELSRFIGSDFDIILAEGFKRGQAPKIEVHRKELRRDLLCTQDELIAIATDEQLEMNVPQYSPDDAHGLVDLIEKKYFNKAEKARGKMG